jgi:ATPase subunit of ABC transporter with duplicated ATPase domains
MIGRCMPNNGPKQRGMIQLTGAGKRFGPKILFENLDWLVTPNERTGIVGANGTGKSTLLKVLAGIDRSTTAPSP